MLHLRVVQRNAGRCLGCSWETTVSTARRRIELGGKTRLRHTKVGLEPSRDPKNSRRQRQPSRQANLNPSSRMPIDLRYRRKRLAREQAYQGVAALSQGGTVR
jgi:hypothetical protein